MEFEETRIVNLAIAIIFVYEYLYVRWYLMIKYWLKKVLADTNI